MYVSQMIRVHQFLRVVNIAYTAVVLGMMDVWWRTFVPVTYTGSASSEWEIHLVHSTKMKVEAASVGVTDGAHTAVEMWIVDVGRWSSVIENSGLTVAHYSVITMSTPVCVLVCACACACVCICV